MEKTTHKIEAKNTAKDCRLSNLPAGTYYIGDPCYVINNDPLWKDLCALWFPKDDPAHCHNGYEMMEMTMTIKGKTYKWVVFDTAYGDGKYTLNNYKGPCNSLPVDAGCLSIIPVDMIKALGEEKSLEKKGNFVPGGILSLPDMVVKLIKQGVIEVDEDCKEAVGLFDINTDDEEEEREDYRDDEDDDY